MCATTVCKKIAVAGHGRLAASHDVQIHIVGSEVEGMRLDGGKGGR